MASSERRHKRYVNNKGEIMGYKIVRKTKSGESVGIGLSFMSGNPEYTFNNDKQVVFVKKEDAERYLVFCQKKGVLRKFKNFDDWEIEEVYKQKD